MTIYNLFQLLLKGQFKIKFINIIFIQLDADELFVNIHCFLNQYLHFFLISRKIFEALRLFLFI